MISLSMVSGTPLYLNPSEVVSVRAADFAGRTEVLTTTGVLYTVTETAINIVDKMGRVHGRNLQV